MRMEPSKRARQLQTILAESICVHNTFLAYQAAIKRRDEVIRAAVSDGLSQRAAAETAGLAPGRINAIVHRGGSR